MRKTLFVFLTVLLVFSLSVYAKNDKIHKNLEKFLDDDDYVSVIVQFDNKPGDQEDIGLQSLGCEIKRHTRHMNLVIAECPGTSLENLVESDDVIKLWEDEILSFTLDYSAPQINATVAWTNGYNGSGVKVAVLDTGINSSHPALIGQVILEKDFTTDNNPHDFCNHGTHVASIIGSTNETYKGIAHGASLFNGKVGRFVTETQCGASASNIMSGIDWAIANGGHVISMSIGSPISDCSLSITANYVNATVITDNVPIVIGAGNGGPSYGSIWTPGCAENAITVGAVDDSNAIASFSSRGPVNDGGINRTKPDILAPGINIISAENNGGGWNAATGTSYSTPHVSGVAALVFQAKPGLSQSQVKEI